MTTTASDRDVPQEHRSFLGSVYYDNPEHWNGWRRPGLYEFGKMKCTESNQAGLPSNKSDLNKTLPVHQIVKGSKEKQELDNPPKNEIQIMWIGHATLLVQMDGMNILTDPVFLDRCSPVQAVGPKRYRPVPCSIEDLPDIDAVVISHNHYDHLEHDAVIKLNRKSKPGNPIRWFVPKGMRSWFEKYECKNIAEMTWWDEERYDKEDTKAVVHCVPAQHWSQRGPLDAMTSLWCGWVIIGSQHTFYYTGDTGYCPVFTKIGKMFGPIDLSAIPIGCYAPEYFMKPQHISPEYAVKIHKEVKSKRSVAIHWGTFDGLGSHEPYMEPKERLERATENEHLKDDEFFTIDHGLIKVIENERQSKI